MSLSGKPRKIYSAEFRAKAAQLCNEKGYTIDQVAEQDDGVDAICLQAIALLFGQHPEGGDLLDCKLNVVHNFHLYIAK